MGMRAKLVEIGIDWMTLTTKNSARGVEWHEAFNAVAAIRQGLGEKWSGARRLGYEGEQCGGIFWGKGAQGWMVVMSSSLAQEHAALFDPDAVHCTRVDIQVTAELLEQNQQFIPKTYAACLLRPTKNGHPVKYSHVEDSEGAHTLYVGSRQSMQFGRVYDKGMEQKTHPAGKLIRWELEIKGEYADQAVAMLWGESNQEGVILHLLKQFFEGRGVPCPWNAIPSENRFVPPVVSHDDAGSLKWLAGPVAGVVERLLGTVGPETTMRALLSRSSHLLHDCDIINAVALVVAD